MTDRLAREKYLQYFEENLPGFAETQDASQVSTDSFEIVEESKIETTLKNKLTYLLKNDGDNSVDFEIRGRTLQYNDSKVVNTSKKWDMVKEGTIASGGYETIILNNIDMEFNQFAVFIKSTASGQAGSVEVFGVTQTVI